MNNPSKIVLIFKTTLSSSAASIGKSMMTSISNLAQLQPLTTPKMSPPYNLARSKKAILRYSRPKSASFDSTLPSSKAQVFSSCSTNAGTSDLECLI
jgi:hypothetical protein